MDIKGVYRTRNGSSSEETIVTTTGGGITNLRLEGAIVPKARPRFGQGRAFTAPKYRDWKDHAIGELRRQYQGLPIERAAIAIVLSGKHPRRGDLDNLAGSVLDALVQSEILKDDSIAIVHRLSIALEWAKSEPMVSIKINRYS